MTPKRNGTAMVAVTSGVPAWQQQLRAAMYDAVKESDIKEIVEGIVKRAKGGDRAALQFVFDYLLGGKVPQHATQHNHYYGVDPRRKNKAKAGSRARVEELRAKAAAGRRLFSGSDDDED